VTKILGLFDVRKAPESKKHVKTKCASLEKPNERGLVKKSLDSMESMSRSLIN
jgi:hypothetical protein